jgi:hypothetical protein
MQPKGRKLVELIFVDEESAASKKTEKRCYLTVRVGKLGEQVQEEIRSFPCGIDKAARIIQVDAQLTGKQVYDLKIKGQISWEVKDARVTLLLSAETPDVYKSGAPA